MDKISKEAGQAAARAFENHVKHVEKESGAPVPQRALLETYTKFVTNLETHSPGRLAFEEYFLQGDSRFKALAKESAFVQEAQETYRGCKGMCASRERIAEVFGEKRADIAFPKITPWESRTTDSTIALFRNAEGKLLGLLKLNTAILDADGKRNREIVDYASFTFSGLKTIKEIHKIDEAEFNKMKNTLTLLEGCGWV